MPAIFAFWHGQRFMTPFIKTKNSYRAKVLISRHRDGEFNAIAVERLGIGTIRGSGDHGGGSPRHGRAGAVSAGGGGPAWHYEWVAAAPRTAVRRGGGRGA